MLPQLNIMIIFDRFRRTTQKQTIFRTKIMQNKNLASLRVFKIQLFQQLRLRWSKKVHLKKLKQN